MIASGKNRITITIDNETLEILEFIEKATGQTKSETISSGVKVLYAVSTGLVHLVTGKENEKVQDTGKKLQN